MAITAGTRFFANDTTTSSHSFSVAVGTNDKLIAFVCYESASITVSNAQFNGTAVSAVSGSPWTYTGGGGAVTIYAFYIDTSVGSGSYNFTYTTSSNTPSSLTAFPLAGAAAGAPESIYSDTQDTTGSVVGDVGSLTVTAGAYVMACAINSATTPTVTVGGNVTLGDNSTTNGYRVTNAADIQATGGAKTATFTYDSTSTTKLMVAVSVAEAVTGLSITSVDTDNAVLASQSQATFAGTGLASTAKFAVKRGSAIAYGADISLSGSTGGSFTAPTMTAMFSAGVRFGDVAFFAAETSGTAIASISGSITTATNWKYVNVTDLSATGSMGSLFYNNAVSLSDQVAYSSVTTRFRWPVTVSGDGYFTVNSSGSQAGDEFAYRIWDETDSTWGTEGTIELNGGILSAEQVYAAGSLVQVSLESSTLEGATLQ